MVDFVQGETTTATRDDAERIARELIERRLVACAQVSGPVRSVFRWEGDVQTEDEFVLTVKTSSRLVERVTEAVGELHPYDVPQIVFLAMRTVAAPYAAWLEECLEQRH